MSGFEFIGVVRRRDATIPVIALSSSIPDEPPPEIKPDRWFEKSTQRFPEFLQIVSDRLEKPLMPLTFCRW